MPSICLNELANYNNGNLVWKWFNLDNFSNADEYNEAVQEWLETCPGVYGSPCEEWNIADAENIPEQFVGDYSFDVEGFYTFKELNDQLEEGALEAYLAIFSEMPESVEQFNDRFFGISEEKNDEWPGFYIELGEQLVDENGMLEGVPEEVANYFDYEKYGRDRYLNDLNMSNGFLFWNR